MGVEEIQKINALARELMRHGIATTSDVALLKAEEMLRGNGVNSMTSAIMSHTSIGKSETHASQETLSGLNMDIRSLGMRFDAIAREVLGLKDEIKKLNGSLGDMGRQINRVTIQSQAPSVTPVIEHHAATEAVQHAQPVQQSFARETVQPAQFEKSTRMINVKTGKEEFKSEDVAIEKIFYFGK